MDFFTEGFLFFQKGGMVMYVLLFCSILVFAIGCERYLFFRAEDAGRIFSARFAAFMSEGKEKDAMELAAQSAGCLPQILVQAVRKAGRNEHTAAHYMETQAGIVFAKLRARLYYLSVIVTMAPLLGLLGTISGMVSSFSVFGSDSGQIGAITGGVGEALIATGMGLLVAIFALTVHAYFSQRLENIITDMELCFSIIEERIADSEELARLTAVSEKIVMQHLKEVSA